MKRAKLTVVPTFESGPARDVTDRLLDGSPELNPAPRRRRTAKRASLASQPPAETKTQTQTQTQTPLPTPRQPTAAQPKAEPPRHAGGSLAAALNASWAAVETLQAAAMSEPACYDIAIRYRLDALAHHVEQVAEFLAGRLQRGSGR